MSRKTLLDYFSSQGPSDPQGDDDSFEAFVNDVAAESQAEKSERPSGLKKAKRCKENQTNTLGFEVVDPAPSGDVFSSSLEPAQDATGDDASGAALSKHAEGPSESFLEAPSSTHNHSFLESDAGSCARQEQGEERYAFMVDIRDAQGVRRGEPGYDSSTLYVPEEMFRKFTPFEKQFWSIKKEHFDTVILFKKGAFYEVYENDAEIAARLFDMRTSSRVNMRMAGFPEKSYDTWAAKFIEHGFKVGRVEQAENMIGKKLRERAGGSSDKIINRELKEIVTAGTIYNPDYITAALPFYTAVVVEEGGAADGSGMRSFCVLLYDASINRLYIKHVQDRSDLGALKSVFIQYDIREVISDVDLSAVTQLRPIRPSRTCVVSQKKYELTNEAEYTCFTYLHNYMVKLCRADALDSAVLTSLETCDSFPLDGSTLANLDVLVNNYDGTTKHTLFGAINHCTTAFGQRLLKRWLINPLTNTARICERRAHAALFEGAALDGLKERLASIGDLERRVARLSNSNPRFKDLTACLMGLARCADFLSYMADSIAADSTGFASGARTHAAGLQDLLGDFYKAFQIGEDEVRPGALNEDLSALGAEYSGIEQSIQRYLSDLKGATKLHMLAYKSLNRDLFQIEAPVDVKMPSEFYVVSTTKSHRRYYSPALRALIMQLQEAEEKIFQAKGNLLRQAIEFVVPRSDQLYAAVSYVARVDCYISFAVAKQTSGLVLPEIVDSDAALEISSCCSPVYPRNIRNDFRPTRPITIVSGPNMGGKSTFLRSICLNIILAQMGMGVACEAMRLPVFDQIFTRIGASDSLARGESTFMAELSEASRIMGSATRRSFVIMDELGRGTSTGDGTAIAQAVLDYLKGIGCYTLFSTHYHGLVQKYEGVDKVYIDCVIDQDDIVFLYKIKNGVCLDSHGLYVARLAGVPDAVVGRARAIKDEILEKNKV
ncbi:DNA mismatch repair protein MSH6 [Pancytospora philotis]|nr:DNA mismatch repair protein MSH6 [Pancytospora philotis]